MKHPFSITAVLVLLFFCTQAIGIGLLFLDGDVSVNEAGEQEIEYSDTAIGERPDMDPQSSFWFIAIGVALGTALMFLLIKFKAFRLWKLWFFLAIFFSLAVAFEVIMPALWALILGAVLAGWKSLRPNPIIHNLTELFMYAGILILLAPLFNLFWAVALLLVISIYDAIAVWKSKHMITLAKAQTDRKMFAGLYIPKGKKMHVPPPKHPKKKSKRSGSAILGGGDIAFPMLFAGVVLQWLIEVRGIMPNIALYYTLIIALGATAALAFLFAYSKKDTFYPAMPFITAGCLLGLGVVSLLTI